MCVNIPGVNKQKPTKRLSIRYYGDCSLDVITVSVPFKEEGTKRLYPKITSRGVLFSALSIQTFYFKALKNINNSEVYPPKQINSLLPIIEKKIVYSIIK